MADVVKQAEELDAAFNQGYEFEAAGRTFTVRRLNIHDIFALARICAVGIRALGPELASQDVSELDEETLITVLSAAIPLAEDEVIEWAASLVSMSKEEFENLPPDVLLGIIETLKDHVDVKAFFARLIKLIPSQTKPISRKK